MKNPELPCWEPWQDECVDGYRCPVHEDCGRLCGDTGFFYQPPPESYNDPDWDDWENCKVPCKCQEGKQ